MRTVKMVLLAIALLPTAALADSNAFNAYYNNNAINGAVDVAQVNSLLNQDSMIGVSASPSYPQATTRQPQNPLVAPTTTYAPTAASGW